MLMATTSYSSGQLVSQQRHREERAPGCTAVVTAQLHDHFSHYNAQQRNTCTDLAAAHVPGTSNLGWKMAKLVGNKPKSNYLNK